MCCSATRASAVVRAGVSGPEPRTSMSRPVSVAVAWMSSGLLRGLEHFGDGPGGGDRAVEAGREDRAAVDRHDVVRARRGKADLEHVVRAAPRMQHGAAAALRHARRSGLVDRRDQAGLRQRLDDQRALPLVIFGERPMLHGAAAADAEMLADRRDALVARLVDMQQMPPVGMAGDGSTVTVSPGSV